jgi:hypothetical protein
VVALRWDEMSPDDLVEQRVSRPHLYVGQEGPRPSGRRRGAPAYRRRQQRRWKFVVRRALVVVAIASLGALAWSVAEKLVAVASPGGGSAASCTTITARCPGAQAYVAAPGDTVWSIAVRFAHGGDPRPLVDRLEAEIGGGVLQPGQRLVVP